MVDENTGKCFLCKFGQVTKINNSMDDDNTVGAIILLSMIIVVILEALATLFQK